MLNIGVDRRFLRGAEAGAHVDALGAQAERGDEAAAVAEAARGEHRDLHLVGRRGGQDQPRDIILAGMTRALEAVDRKSTRLNSSHYCAPPMPSPGGKTKPMR